MFRRELLFSALVKERLVIPAEHEGAIWFLNQAWEGQSHYHDELELNIVTSGRGSYRLGSRCYEVTANSMVWLFPQQEHVLFEQSSDFKMFISVFSPQLVKRSCRSPSTALLCQGDPEGNFCKKVTKTECNELQRLLREVMSGSSDSDYFNAGLLFVLQHSWRCFKRVRNFLPSTLLHPAVMKAAQLLEENQRFYSNGELAQAVFLSESQLSRNFHQEMGCTIAAFRNQMRLEAFFRIIKKRPITILDAALEANFGSYSQFYKVFKTAVGISPREYTF